MGDSTGVKMNIFRTVKDENPFAQVDKKLINDPTISWKTKGILIYLLSKPNDWTVQINNIISNATDGRDSVRAGLREAEKAGYIIKKQLKDEQNKFSGIEYHVFEVPIKSPADGISVNGFSVSGISADGKSPTTNNDITNNDSTNNKKEEEANANAFVPLPISEDQNNGNGKHRPSKKSKEKEGDPRVPLFRDWYAENHPNAYDITSFGEEGKEVKEIIGFLSRNYPEDQVFEMFQKYAKIFWSFKDSWIAKDNHRMRHFRIQLNRITPILKFNEELCL